MGPGDHFRPLMACPYSTDEHEYVCIGYVAQEGYSNISVRLIAAQGRIDLAAIWEACEKLDLWPDFETMLAAYEEANNQGGVRK